MIPAEVAATTRSDRPEGEETGEGPGSRHERSQAAVTRRRRPARRSNRPAPGERPTPTAREWFATTANASPAGYVAWFRHPDGELYAEPITGLLTQHLHEVDAQGYRQTSRGSLDTRVVPAVFDPEGGVSAVDEVPGFLAVTPVRVTAEEITRRYPDNAAAE